MAGGSTHSMQMLQSRALLPGEPVVKYLPAQHCLYPSPNPFILLFIHLTVNSSLHPFSLLHSHLTKMMHLLTHLFICPSIHLSTHVSVCFPSVRPTIPLSIHPSFYAFIPLPTHSAHASTCHPSVTQLPRTASVISPRDGAMTRTQSLFSEQVLVPLP